MNRYFHQLETQGYIFARDEKGRLFLQQSGWEGLGALKDATVRQMEILRFVTAHVQGVKGTDIIARFTATKDEKTIGRDLKELEKKQLITNRQGVYVLNASLVLPPLQLDPAEKNLLMEDLAVQQEMSPRKDEVKSEQRLQKLRKSMQDDNLKILLDRILDHPTIGALYRQAPAAMKMHQAYLRGLWEHSLGVAELALSISVQYPEVNSDLLLVGALLHDIGKIFEYKFERGISFTTDGRLLGHIVMGIDLLSREIANIPEFPLELRTKLLHIITSHHGRYGWQSPRRPKCLEAVIIHYADAMEADLWQFRQAKQDNPNEEWSPYVKSMERFLYLG